MRKIARTSLSAKFLLAFSMSVHAAPISKEAYKTGKSEISARYTADKAAHALKARGLMNYRCGAIDILDGPGLEAASCSCYQAIPGHARHHGKH